METDRVQLLTLRTSTQAQLQHPIRSGILGVIVLALLLSAGCAHEQAYKRGEKLSQEGQYDRAVQELEAAVRLAEERKNYRAATEYQQRLDEVKLQAGQFYYREAEMRLKWAELSAAQSLIEKSIMYCPQEQTYQTFRQRILQAMAQAEQLRDEALALAEQQQWQAAMQRMNEALALYRTMPGGDANLKHIRERAYGYYIDRAQGKLLEGDLANAEAGAQAALLYEGAGKEAKAVIQAVKDRREAAGLIAHGRKLLEQGQAEGRCTSWSGPPNCIRRTPSCRTCLGRRGGPSAMRGWRRAVAPWSLATMWPRSVCSIRAVTCSANMAEWTRCWPMRDPGLAKTT